MLRAKRDDNPVVLRPLRPLKLADAERTISLTWLDLGSVTNVMEEPAVELPLLTGPAGCEVLCTCPARVKDQAASCKLQATSHKLQASSLTRKDYRIIKDI